MPKKNRGKPKGRRQAYFFFVQVCSQEHAKLHPDDKIVLTDLSRCCSERWKTMTPDEKKVYEQMAEKDKDRYNLEMRDYVPPKGGQGGKTRKLKDPNAPKRSLSSFLLFCFDERPKIRERFPSATTREVGTILGRMWAEAGEETKRVYKAKADRDKARYNKEMEVYTLENCPPLPEVFIEIGD